jgi:short-subunit dehydrogenase
MSARLKPLDQQVIVITGASSGIGLMTAAAAAQRGAKLVLAGRSEQTLDDIVAHITAAGGDAIAVGCDVADRQQVQSVADAAIARFGRIDTWVNNAGVGMYGRLDVVSEEDNRRLFDTNFWGVVNGSLVALPHLKTGGGALINVGSEVSEAVVPLLGMYAASKHAVKGFTDALRIEIEDVDKAPVSITLIQPSAVDTPFPQHARNYMDREPKLPDPMIEPIQVAEAILAAAVKPTRAAKVGLMASVNTTLPKLSPMLADMLSSLQVNRQQCNEPPRNPMGALYEPCEDGQVFGEGCAAAK